MTIRNIFNQKNFILFAVVYILFIAAVTLRFYRIDDRAWFSGDTSSEMLYALNVISYGKPLFIGMVTSGSTFPNLPYYVNFLAILLWLSKGNPATVMHIITILASSVTPMLFLWGVVEGAPLAGLLAAICFMVLPGGISMANIWGNFLAFIPGAAGIIIFRYSIRKDRTVYRNLGLVFLSVASVLHYSYIGLIATILVVEFLRLKNFRRLRTDALVAASSFGVFLIPTVIALAFDHTLSFPSIKYTHNTCIACLHKIPDIITPFVLFCLNPKSDPVYILSLIGAAIGLAITGIVTWRKMTRWIYTIPIIFLFIVWLLAGHAAYWYIFPILPFGCYLFGEVTANGLSDRRKIIKFIAGTVFIIYVALSLSVINDGLFSTSRFDVTYLADLITQETMGNYGIPTSQYLEYGNIFPEFQQPDADTTGFWFMRQWHNGGTLTRNDPTRYYDPAPVNLSPEYRVYVYGNCGKKYGLQSGWLQEGYVLDQIICRKDYNFQFQIYKLAHEQ